MYFVVAVLTCCVLYGVKIAKPGCFHEDMWSPGKTNAVKGLFVLIVFLSHMRGYTNIPEHEMAAFSVAAFLGQLMVVPFLFWSGYGVMESIKKKGAPYIRQIPIRRIGITLLHFDLAVLLFLAVCLIVGRPVSLRVFLLSLIGWESIGNSNWYIFVVLLLYLITYISFILFPRKVYAGAVVTTVLSVLAVQVLFQYRDFQWHDTLLCYVLGMWVSLLRKPLEKILLHNDICWILSTGVVAWMFSVVYRMPNRYVFMPHICALIFAGLLILLAEKIMLDNRFLQFLGKYTFWIYILQRIPMILCAHFGILTELPALFFLVTFALTCALSVGLDALAKRLDRVILQRI